ANRSARRTEVTLRSPPRWLIRRRPDSGEPARISSTEVMAVPATGPTHGLTLCGSHTSVSIVVQSAYYLPVAGLRAWLCIQSFRMRRACGARRRSRCYPRGSDGARDRIRTGHRAGHGGAPGVEGLRSRVPAVVRLAGGRRAVLRAGAPDQP